MCGTECLSPFLSKEERKFAQQLCVCSLPVLKELFTGLTKLCGQSRALGAVGHCDLSNTGGINTINNGRVPAHCSTAGDTTNASFI